MDVSLAEDAMAPISHSEQAVLSLQPSKHRERFLHLQSAARHAGPSDPSSRFNSILALVEAYRHASDLIALLPHDWDIFLALEIRLAAATSPLTPDSLQNLFELHKAASLQYKSTGLIKRYISLVLAYVRQLSGVHIAFSESAADSTTSHVSDPALNWTSLESCPNIDASQSTYITSSLPPLASDTNVATAWEPVCGLEAVRWRIREAYTMCAYQLQESQDAWKLYLAFEEALLMSPHVSRDQQLETLRQVYLARLKVPHAAIDETFQAFSSFVTQHLPPQQYESEMTAANVLVAESKSFLRHREQFEDSLSSILCNNQLHAAGSRQDLDNFASNCKPYLRWQSNRTIRVLRSKDKAMAQTKLNLTCGLYERLIPHFGLHPPTSRREELIYYSGDVQGAEHYSRQFKRLSQEERDARIQQEQQLLAERLSLATELWLDYISVLTSSSRPDASLIMDVCARSVRCLPTSISLHCVLMRSSARFLRSRPQIEQLFEKVITPGALQLNATELADLCLARIDCERELASYDLVVKAGADLNADPAQDMNKFTEIYALLSYALSKLAELGEEQRDPSLRLEQCTVNWVERAVFAMGGPASEGGAGLNELAESVWQTAVTQQPDNALVYRLAAAYWMRRFDARKARGWFKAGVQKLERKAQQGAEQNTAEYQTLLQEWVQFEHQHGSVEEVESADGKARAERNRAMEAWYASYAQYGYSTEGQAQQASAQTNGEDAPAMQVEQPSGQLEQANGSKRKANEGEDAAVPDAPMADGQTSSRQLEINPNNDGADVEQPKKTRTNDAESAPARDREHCSVLVAGLHPSTGAQAVRTLLRGCGRIVELSGPTVVGESESAALVEFADPSGSASALTRHGKPLNESLVTIHIGWKCTLFVTNFPEEWDDSQIRSTFSPYGRIFNVRWPSKRFVSTRRFCYVQYTTPDAATAAVAALDKSEVAPGRSLNVALSDPSRRKQRTDAHENAKELFVSGFPRNITEDELKTYFADFGTVKGVRLLRNAEGWLRGIGFVDFEKVLDANRAMRELNSTKWRGKTISVTIADNRNAHGAAHRATPAEMAERRTRSIRVEDLPVDAQEALIQQAVERAVGLGTVKQVLWRPDGTTQRATVEFNSPAEAGKAVLIGQTGSIKYDDAHTLAVTAMDDAATADVAMHGAGSAGSSSSGKAAATTPLAFVPRASRGGRGRGRGRVFAAHHPAIVGHTTPHTGDDMDVETSTSDTRPMTGQDRFRAMMQ